MRGPSPASKALVTRTGAEPDTESLKALPSDVFDALTPRQMVHLSWLALFPEDKQARKYSGVAVQTIGAWKRDDSNYVEAVSIVAANKIEFAGALMKTLLIKATATLDDLLSSGDEEIQISAVRLVLNTFNKQVTEKKIVQNEFHIENLTFEDTKKFRESEEFKAIMGEVLEVSND